MLLLPYSEKRLQVHRIVRSNQQATLEQFSRKTYISNPLQKIYITSLKFFVFVIASVCLLSCDDNDTRRIVGNIKNLGSRKVYLTDAYNWTIHLDSVIAVEGKFSFELRTSKYRDPFLASLYVVNHGKVEPLLVINYKTSTQKDTQATTGFFLEKHSTVINGDFNEYRRRMHIRPGPENDLLFDKRTQFFAFQPSGDKKTLAVLQRTISQHPSSYFLLYSLNQFRAYHHPEELKSLLSFFDKKVRRSPTGLSLLQYADNVVPIGDRFGKIVVKTLQGKEVDLFARSSGLNMWVFWASWCGPCRAEIPYLKQLAKEFEGTPLSISSISVDASISDWQKALDEEQMPWQQFLLAGTDSLIQEYKTQLNISAIPLIIFTDKSRLQLRRFTGYSKGDETLKSFIREQVEAPVIR